MRPTGTGTGTGTSTSTGTGTGTSTGTGTGTGRKCISVKEGTRHVCSHCRYVCTPTAVPGYVTYVHMAHVELLTESLEQSQSVKRCAILLAFREPMFM